MVLGMAGLFGGNLRTAAVAAEPKVKAAGKPLLNKPASKFSPLLEATLAVSSKSQKSVVTAKSSTAAATNSSLTLLNGLPPVKVLTDDSTPPPPPPAAAAAAPSPVDVLTAALTQAGVDTRGMQFQEHTDVVTYPGGSYTNHLITMTAGGKTQDYMADLMMINPHVTVVEIQQLLAGNRHGIG